jgi:hypothetical protein
MIFFPLTSVSSRLGDFLFLLTGSHLLPSFPFQEEFHYEED